MVLLFIMVVLLLVKITRSGRSRKDWVMSQGKHGAAWQRGEFWVQQRRSERELFERLLFCVSQQTVEIPGIIEEIWVRFGEKGATDGYQRNSMGNQY